MSWWKRLLNKARGVFGASASSNGCSHSDAVHLRQGTAEFEWFVARSELEMERDLAHGASHLANLLSYDPGNPEWVELLEQYLAAAAPDPESLIPRGDELFYATEALRAYIWHRDGRLREAVHLLVSVVHAKPDAKYLEAWALDWLEPEGTIESLPEDAATSLFSHVLNRFPEAKCSPAFQLRNVRRWAALCERAAKHGNLAADDMVVMLRAGLLRKAAMFDEARLIARAAMEVSPSWHAATALGLVLRQQGNPREAEQAFRAALELDPSDIAARLEAADTFFEIDDWQTALKWYENALNAEPGQPWAAPSALFCSWMLTDDEDRLRQLFAFARSNHDNHRAQFLCNLAAYPDPPEPCDATANLLRDFRDQILSDPEDAPCGEVQLSLSGLKAPSNFLVFRIEMEALQHDMTLQITVEDIASPDPRRPVADVRYALWAYDGTDARPALASPGDDVSQQIAKLAAAKYNTDVNWASASRVAEQLGVARVEEILATMVHPPAAPPSTSALAWLPRVQMAAAQVVAHLDAGWEGSTRREALLSVLHGPSDWTTQAAIQVLSRIGCEEEAHAPDIHDAFQQLANHRPSFGYCCWERTLYEYWLDLPHLFDNEREAIRNVLRELDAAEEAAQQQSD